MTAETPLGRETSKRVDGSETGGNLENVSGILTDASTLLKTLKPCTKAVKVKRVMPSDGPTGLLDGGAANALRREPHKNWKPLKPCWLSWHMGRWN